MWERQFPLPSSWMVEPFLSSSRETTSFDQMIADHQLITTANISGGCCSVWQLFMPPLCPAESVKMPSPVSTPQLECLAVPMTSLCQWELSRAAVSLLATCVRVGFILPFCLTLVWSPRGISLSGTVPCCAGIPKLTLTPNQFSYMSSMPVRLLKMLYAVCLYDADLWLLPPSCYMPQSGRCCNARKFLCPSSLRLHSIHAMLTLINEFLSPRSHGRFLRLEEVSIRNLADKNLWGETFSSGKWGPIITAMLFKIKLIILKNHLGEKERKIEWKKISQKFQFLLLKLLFLWGILKIVSYILQGKVKWFCWSRTFWWI